MLLAVVSAARATAATYYVDGANSAASDKNPGTAAQPYKTITGAMSAHAGAGTTLIVRPAVYPEQITVLASGALDNPFVIQAQGPGVIVDGSDNFSGASLWTAADGGAWVAKSVNWSPLQVFVDGQRLTVTTADPAAMPPNTFEYQPGKGLYVNASGNPGLHQTYVGHRLYGFRLSGRSYVTIDGFTVTRTEDRSIYLASSSNRCTVSNCTVTFSNKYGIALTSSSGELVVSNKVSDGNDHGINLSSVAGSVLRDNESFRNAKPDQRIANGIYVGQSTGNRFERNNLHHNQDTGLYFAGGGNNNTCVQNRSWSNGDHGYDHLGASNNIHVGDLAYANYKDGFSMEGNSPGTVIRDCIAVDNGLTTREFDLWVDNTSTAGFVSDYNIFWNSVSGTYPVKYINTLYTLVALYANASGQDAHTIQADPRFTAAASGDFHLLAGSSAIDAADTSPSDWPALDTDGIARVDDPSVLNSGVGNVIFADRGPYEYVPGAGGDQAPIVTAPAGVSGPEGSPMQFTVTASDAQPLTSLTATGLPAGASFTPGADYTSGTFSWTPSFTAAGSYTVTFRASNTLTGAVQTSLTISNVDRAPVVVAGPATIAEGQTLSLAVHAVDPDGDAIVSLAASNLPAGASFTVRDAADTSGTLSWTPGYDASPASPFLPSFSAVANGLSTTVQASITVTNTDRPPVLAAPATVTVPEGQPLSFTVHAIDPDSDPFVSLVATGLPSGATFAPADAGDSSGTFAWTPDYNAAASSPRTVTFTASAGGASVPATTSITIVNVDRAPWVIAPAQASVNEGQTLTFAVHAGDPDGDPVSSLTATGMPAGAAFTPGDAADTSGTFVWTPGFTQSGASPYTLAITAVANGRSTSASVQITVVNIDAAPVVVAPPARLVAENTPLTFVVHAVDPDGDVIPSLVASPLPPGASFTPGDAADTSGVFSWTPAHADAPGPYTVTFTASNTQSGSAATVITVDRPPRVAAPASTAVDPTQALTFTVTASDEQAIDALSASGLPSGAKFTVDNPQNSSATFTWVPTFAQIGTYTVAFTASANGLAGTAQTQITVNKADQPPIVVAPATVLVTENTLLTFTVHAADVDGQAITSLTASGLPAGATFAPLDAGDTSGAFSWTPSHSDAPGPWAVSFTASNVLSGSTTSSISVDRPPVATVKSTFAVNEGQTIQFQVTAGDEQPIASLTASGLPQGASFTPDNAQNTSGTFTWTPGFTAAAASPYGVTFTAANGLTGTAQTQIVVNDVDQPPTVTSAATVSVNENQQLTVVVTAADPDSQPISALTANLAGLPAGHNAQFTVTGLNSTVATGTLTWTPTYSDAPGPYAIAFTASANGLSGSRTTNVTVSNVDRPPAVTVNPTATVDELQVLTLIVTASDPDGQPITTLTAGTSGLPAGNNAKLTVTGLNTATATGTFTWTPTSNDGRTSPPYVVTFTATNALTGSAQTAVTVNDVPVNLCGNGGFETNLTGWNASGTATLTRVAGGIGGGFALEMQGSSTIAGFGANDSPNWITSTGAVGTRYRYTAWVRSAANSGRARIKLREYSGSTQVGSTVYSPYVTLSPAWQMVTLDFIVQGASHTLDMQVIDDPVAANEVFQLDNVSIYLIASAPSMAARPAEGVAPLPAGGNGPGLEFSASVAPNPLRAQAVFRLTTTRAGAVRVVFYDTQGRAVRELVRDAALAPGRHEFALDPRGTSARLGPGVYFYRVDAADGVRSGRFVILE